MRISIISSLCILVSTFSINSPKPICRRNLMKMASAPMISSPIVLGNPMNSSATSEEVVIEPLSLYFYGAVTDESCLALTQALGAYDLKAKHQKISFPSISPHIDLHIQSGGGSLMPTFFVCDVIKNLDTPVHIYIDGFAASAASLIAVCGKKRYITKHSSMMIHQLTGASSGKFQELANEMANFKFFMDLVKDIYISNTKLNGTLLEELLSGDIWLDANKCLKYGMIDKII